MNTGKDIFQCSFCGRKAPRCYTDIAIGNEIFCTECAKRETVCCELCGKFIRKADDFGEDFHLCLGCSSELFFSDWNTIRKEQSYEWLAEASDHHPYDNLID